MNYSLAMSFELTETGTWVVKADWLEEPVEAPSYQEAYWKAVALRKPG